MLAVRQHSDCFFWVDGQVSRQGLAQTFAYGNASELSDVSFDMLSSLMSECMFAMCFPLQGCVLVGECYTSGKWQMGFAVAVRD